MNKYVVEVTEGQQFTAGSKAKQDISTFLLQDNFSKISIKIPSEKFLRVIKGKNIWKKALSDVREGDLVVYQYPAYSRVLGDYFIKVAKKIRNCLKVVLIHDLDSLRIYRDSPKDITRELKFLNEFDSIICHNKVMKKWLELQGITKPVYALEIFDYDDNTQISNRKKDDPIVFAGNLEKSKFLELLTSKINFNVFGVSPADSYPRNIHYQGAFPAEQLGEHLSGSFGLVWDGDSLDECSGMTGEYMKYNNPHKTSLYLSLGIPVIIWDSAALSSFIEDNEVGIAVSNLNELDQIISNISEERYMIIKNNAIKMAGKIRNGYYTKKVINEIIGNN